MAIAASLAETFDTVLSKLVLKPCMPSLRKKAMTKNVASLKIVLSEIVIVVNP